ncbi:hypothetical protein EYR40_000390 [Pleurotus pulmonarius]|nr:hypothetical protein EYR36_010052 [Pleurotus pulmonarius]KAF4579441.1 hypothetical protein EYR36_001253 [Pleurotus pulmonarius]KAF4580557.1 hypothetical protein EYR38_003156 [Pleurotus pulmonarius]KAF4589004.1 hypothetical protein EYR40_010560 [Pleurotus pulmonarius]KAF4608048.1 hypothetical protein EYR40_000390 [Pleurotus pulmonarius]
MSQSGNVTICGLAVLENPRRYDESKPDSLAFDAQFYLAHGVTLVAHLRFYNDAGWEFDDMGFYMVCANIAQTQSGAKLGKEEINQLVHQVVGDIHWLIPVSVTKDQLRQRPWITVASTVLDNSVDLSEGSFRADAYQFTQANRDTGNPSILPIKALFSKRFTKKPVPKAHSNVTFEGYLSRYSETNDVADCFYVEIENITFQGRSYTPASAKTVETPVTTKRKRNFKFNFDDDDEAPSTPSPIISKRARLSGSDSSSSLTKGMTPVPSRSSQ